MELKAAKYKKEVKWSEEDQVFIASAPDLPGCMAHGDTEAEALQQLNEVITLYLESFVTDELDQNFREKKFLVRMPASFHQKLGKLSSEQECSINELIVDAIRRVVLPLQPKASASSSVKHIKSSQVLHRKTGASMHKKTTRKRA